MSFDGLLAVAVVLGGTFRLATPIAFAALGETLAERSGTLNLGLDGMMTAGAFAAVVGATWGGWPLGLAFALLVGAVMGGLLAAGVLLGRANQIVIGIALSLIGTGLTSTLFQIWQPSGESALFVPLVPQLALPGLSALPLLDAVLSGQNLLTGVAALCLAALAIILSRTRLGLVIRAVGDDPASAALRGLPVRTVRAACLIAGGALGGLGGAAITLGLLGSFTDGVTAGRGYVAIAVVIIGRWTPVGAVAGALLFSLFDSIGLRAQLGLPDVPSEVFSILPYVVTLLVLIATARSRAAPRALGIALPP